MTDFLTRLREANITRDREYRAKTGGEPLPVLFRTTELAGEVGELLNVIKKMERERLGWAGKRADRKMMLEEFGGVMACLDLLAMALDVNLATATADEFNKVTDRLELSTKLPRVPSPSIREAMEALRELSFRAENFWSFLQGEYGISLMAEDQDDHNVYEFFHAIETANRLLASSPPSTPTDARSSFGQVETPATQAAGEKIE